MDNSTRSTEVEKEKLATGELAFLQNQMSDEERRREVIEGKTGQLLGQVSIVVSVISLFIPLISDHISDWPSWQKFICISLFLIVVLAFIISIWIASTSWIISKYGYLRPELKDLHDPDVPETHLLFIERYKNILVETVQQHIGINNTKGTKLIRAGIAFRLGTLILGILVVCLSIALAIPKSSPKVNNQESVNVAMKECTDNIISPTELSVKRQSNDIDSTATKKLKNKQENSMDK